MLQACSKTCDHSSLRADHLVPGSRTSSWGGACYQHVTLTCKDHQRWGRDRPGKPVTLPGPSAPSALLISTPAELTVCNQHSFLCNNPPCHWGTSQHSVCFPSSEWAFLSLTLTPTTSSHRHSFLGPQVPPAHFHFDSLRVCWCLCSI